MKVTRVPARKRTIREREMERLVRGDRKPRELSSYTPALSYVDEFAYRDPWGNIPDNYPSSADATVAAARANPRALSEGKRIRRPVPANRGRDDLSMNDLIRFLGEYDARNPR